LISTKIFQIITQLPDSEKHKIKKNSYQSVNVCQNRPLAGYMLRCLGTIQFAAHAAASQDVFARRFSPSRYFFYNMRKQEFMAKPTRY